MKFKTGVFVRHCDGESIIWCPRTGGCTVMKNCQGFLEEIVDGWRDQDEILAAISRKYGCDIDVIREDFNMILVELTAQNFIDCDDRGGCAIVNGENVDCKNVDVDELGVAFFKQHGIPLELHVDLTNACTERCVHCYVPKGRNDFLQIALADKVLEEFRAVNGLSIHLSGGEAMMHPDFEHVCRKCRELNLNLIILSNMTLCDDRRIAFLKEVCPQFINVSLYSMKPEEHDAITQLPGSWQRTMNAILKCCEAGICCRIATPILKENKHALHALKKFSDEHGLLLAPEYGIVAQSDHCSKNLSHACSADELRLVLTRDHECFREFHNGDMPSCDAKVCDIGETRLFLGAKGDFYACDSMHEYVLGNVRENTVEEIWKGEKLNYLRGLKNRDFGACACCEKRPWCKVCPAANFNATGDLFKHHPSTCELAGVIREVYGKTVTRDA